MMMTDHATAYIEAARTYLGVPWKHQGRSRTGIDCIGLVVLAGRDIGIHAPMEATYGRFGAYHVMKPILLRFGERIGSYEPGAVVLYKTTALLHLAIATDRPGYVIQALNTVGRVTESRINFPALQYWRPYWPC